MARYSDYDYGGWAPYVSVAERKKNAAKQVEKLKKKGKLISPVQVPGRVIARTFWGKCWCENLENYSDFSNRLPRGRTYVRNGSVIDLQINQGKITALVSGSSIYKVTISIDSLKRTTWNSLVQKCSGQINSLVELLSGRFSEGVMEVITQKKGGIFPSPEEIEMDCSCPDSASMCKHVAAVLYGVGARLDEKPELFFILRNVDQSDLIAAAITAKVKTKKKAPPRTKVIQDSDLASVFGIDLE